MAEIASLNPTNLAKADWSTLADWSTRTLMGDPCPWPLGETLSDIQTAQAFFQAEAIAPLCHHALQTAGAGELAPKVIRDLLREKRLIYAAQELSRAHQDARVIQRLNKIGLQPLVLKGAAYAQTLYPEAHLRPRCDTDLLFPDRESAQKAWSHLEEAGYALLPNVVEGHYVSRQKTCVKPGGCGHALDLHWSISNTHTFAQALPYSELDHDAVPLRSLQKHARTLGPIHSLLFACLHFFGHEHGENSVRILWLYDIHLLSQQLSISDWESFHSKAIEKRIAGICRHVLDRAAERFPMKVFDSIRPGFLEAEALEVFRPDRVKTDIGYQLHDLKALDDWSGKVQWILEAVFPAPAYMRNKYGKASSAWLPLLYLHRAAMGLAKRLRRNARSRTD